MGTSTDLAQTPKEGGPAPAWAGRAGSVSGQSAVSRLAGGAHCWGDVRVRGGGGAGGLGAEAAWWREPAVNGWSLRFPNQALTWRPDPGIASQFTEGGFSWNCWKHDRIGKNT